MSFSSSGVTGRRRIRNSAPRASARTMWTVFHKSGSGLTSARTQSPWASIWLRVAWLRILNPLTTA
ncbi:MAG: hypothetical protein MUE47_00400 [Acidobacteria bacterium]|nr:hypothetical protein [Acidobacteriota bacterium]